MKIRIGIAGMLWLMGCLVPFPLGAGETPKTVQVWDNVFTRVHGDGIDSNTTFIITRDGVVVIDTRPTPAEARKVLKEIRKHTDLPILYTINTHFHGDHTFGNQVFQESKTIIAHHNVWRALTGDFGKDHLKQFKTYGLPGTEEIEITPPTLMYETRLEMYPGGYHLQLLHLGPGHTDGDTVVYLEELKMLITGDLVFHRIIPYLGDGFIDGWIESLDELENLGNEIVVPGHGDVGGRPMIIAMKHYLLTLKGKVIEQIKAGRSLQETLEAVKPVLEGKYGSWAHLDRIEDNIRRAFMEYSLKENI